MQGIIKSKQEVAQATLQVTFALKEPFTFQPGQYCFVTLINPPYPDEKSNRRHFSIVNSPNEKGTITITTRIRDSGFKKSLQSLPIGSTAEVGPIAGPFVLPQDQQKPLVFIAGGIGITPFMSMLSYIKETGKPYKITLVYSNRTQQSSAYLDKLQDLEKTIPNFKLILTMTDDPAWMREKRVIDPQFIKDYFPNVNENRYMVVGPPGMVEAIEEALTQAGVTSDNIRKENFTGY